MNETRILGTCLHCDGRIVMRFVSEVHVRGKHMANRYDLTCSKGGDECVKQGLSAAVMKALSGEAP